MRTPTLLLDVSAAATTLVTDSSMRTIAVYLIEDANFCRSSQRGRRTILKKKDGRAPRRSQSICDASKLIRVAYLDLCGIVL